MALFQKKPDISTTVPLYTMGAEKTILIMGLGNPGQKYENTRHNVGIRCIEAFAQEHNFNSFQKKDKLHCQLATQHLGDTQVILARATTFMNDSGRAVQALLNFYKLSPENCIIVSDDIEVPFGSIRTRQGGSDGGHNGLKSIIKHTGADFGRVRVGVGPKQPAAIDSADFVLGSFSTDETKQLPAIANECSVILTEIVFGSGQLTHETRNVLEL